MGADVVRAWVKGQEWVKGVGQIRQVKDGGSLRRRQECSKCSTCVSAAAALVRHVTQGLHSD